jgi:prepilin-type N-terminal cleavage/methylation domain-containing protein
MASHGKSGFTLIEVLVVVVILGILATLAIPRLMNARYDAFRSAALSDLRNLQAVQEIHRQDGTGYAADLNALSFETSRGVSIDITEATQTGWAATATHSGFPSVDCGIFIGTASPANGGPATSQGVVTCSR